jgi:glycosyltransferase involved in cell wall biosynthesis
MKIGIITNLYPPYVRGGAEHVIVRTVEELIERGHDVFIITTKPKGRTRIDVDANSLERIYRFFPRNLYYVLDDHLYSSPIRLFWHVIDAFSRCGAKHVRDIIEREEPDVVMTHNLKGIGLTIPRVIQSMNIPHLHIVHDLQLIIPSGLRFFGHEKEPFYARIVHGIYRMITTYLMGKPDGIISPSRYLKDEYEKHGIFPKDAIQVIPNPAPDFPLLSHRQPPDGPLRLFFIGQLEEHKGVEFLLDFMKKSDRDIMLNIAGEGSMKKQVETAADADKRITYLGYISLDQILNVFEITDGLIIPSLCYENSPTVIYEALQAGVPVLASRIGGAEELVQEGENGFLFEPGSRPDLNRAMALLMAKRRYFHEHRELLRESVAPYALSIYIDRLLELIPEA